MISREPTVPRPVTPLGIIAQNLERLRGAAQVLGYGDASFTQLLEETHRLAAGLDPYLERTATPASAELNALANDTAQRNWLELHECGATSVALEQEMLSGHVEGRLLNMLVRVTGASRILEIGVFTGYSALAMAEALPVDGHLFACEIDAYAAGVAQSWFDRSPHGAKIRVAIGPALATLDALQAAGNSFDFVFIDADKSNYAAYLDRILAGSLLTRNGLICIDNTLMQGEPYLGPRTVNGRAIAAFNQYVADDARVEQVILPIRDGLTLIRRADRAS